ncbi:hypothetical protein GCM10023145_25690 [Angustibacter luteus]
MVAAVFGVLFLVVYGLVLSQQDDVGVAWGYAAAVVIACALSVGGAMTGRSWMILVAAILFTLCMLLGLLSIGILLLPATALAFIAFVFSRKDGATQDGPAPPATTS